MIQVLRRLLSCPVAVFGAIIAVSVIAISAALYSEVALNLEPCILCIYQRIPFVIGGVFGIVGLFLRKNPKAANIILGFLSVNFLVNSGIAGYHTGVEQKWWASKVEGCSANFGDLGAADTPASTQSILENILSAPTGNCAEIPWQDPIIGLSMANYNVLLCLGIFIVCALSVIIRIRHESSCNVSDKVCD